MSKGTAPPSTARNSCSSTMKRRSGDTTTSTIPAPSAPSCTTPGYSHGGPARDRVSPRGQRPPQFDERNPVVRRSSFDPAGPEGGTPAVHDRRLLRLFRFPDLI